MLSGWANADLDETDRAIIARLQSNGRIPFNVLARELEITEATARRRVNRLIDDGIVQVVAVLNSLAFDGTSFAVIEIEAAGATQRMAADIGSWPEVTWVAETFGAASLVLEIMFADRAQLTGIMRRLHQIDGVQRLRCNEYLHITKNLYAGPPADVA